MRKERKHFTPEEKVAILRRHLVDKVPVSELCEELGLRPTVCKVVIWSSRSLSAEQPRVVLALGLLAFAYQLTGILVTLPLP
jgi:transposase-like protein